MDEHQLPRQTPDTLAELAGQARPATPGAPVNPAAAAAAAAAAKKSRTPTPQQLVAQAGNQLDLLRQAETIKQLQGQVKGLEKQSADAGRVFLGTMTALITSAFALVAALAWNSAIQAVFETYLKNTLGGIIGLFAYAVFITIIVVLVIYYLTKLNKSIGGRSLLDDVKASEGGGEGSKKGKEGEK
jgi:uncharacterized membrane protein YidH (DUF202 family)